MNGTDRMRATAVATAKETIARQDRELTATVIRASGFDRFRVALADATDEQVTATAAYWECFTGFIAATHRDLIDHEVEYRQAVARLNAAGPDLVAAITLPTRWEAKR